MRTKLNKRLDDTFIDIVHARTLNVLKVYKSCQNAIYIREESIDLAPLICHIFSILKLTNLHKED